MKLLKKLGLMLVAVVICLAIMEGAVRLFVPLRTVGPTGTTYDPVYGKRLIPSFSARRTGRSTWRMTTNSLGFRGPEPGSPPKNAVLFLGDSMTAGFGVDDGQEFPACVRRRLDEQFGDGDVPVINVGMPGNGNGRWVKFLRNDAERFQPRFVVLQFCGYNDFRENSKERLFALSESGDLMELPVPPRGTLRTVQAMANSIPGVRSSHLLALTKDAVGKATYPPPPSEAEKAYGERLTYRLVDETLGICQQRGWPVIAITVWVEGERLARLRTLFQQHDAAHIHVPPRRERPDLYIKLDDTEIVERMTHWNAGGNAWVADAVYEQLLSDPRFDPPPDNPS